LKPTAAVLTISDSRHRGQREDLAGPRLVRVLSENNFDVVETRILPDDEAGISQALRYLAQNVRFIVTTGGTGIAPRDVTPEATRKVCSRLLDGVSELMRAEGAKHTRFAALSRGVCGTIGGCIVLNLPGNPEGAEQSLRAVLHLIPHALDLLAGKTEHSDSPQKSTSS
jgi:molybdenum cofactor synthesis domain-containing protein